MIKILLTGKNGQVGFHLQRTLPALGEVHALDRQALELTDEKAIRERVRSMKPDVIVNAAAYTAVDQAESDPHLARAINAEAPRIIAEEAAKIGALMVHYSTDYVFDGAKREPYCETPPPRPLNVYGQTKWDGERAIQVVGGPHLIFRASWVYATRGRNFLLTFLQLAHEREELQIVDDQIGAPTWSWSIADATARAVEKILSSSVLPHAASGIYHLTAGGETTWYGFARAILECYEKQPLAAAGRRAPLCVRRITPIPTERYPSAARRPLYSVLSNDKLRHAFGISLPHWQEELREAWQATTLGFERIPTPTSV